MINYIEKLNKLYDEYINKIGDRLHFDNYPSTICGECGKRTNLAFFPSDNKIIAIDINQDGYGIKRTVFNLHKCIKLPQYQCVMCKDKGHTYINVDRTGQDSDYREVTCRNPIHKM